MALIKCPECGKEISCNMLSCPECGYPLIEFRRQNNIKSNENKKSSTEKVRKTNISETEYEKFYSELKKLPGFDAWGTKKEIKYLRTMIYENENVMAIASGIMNGNTWLIACTDRRIIFVDCGMFYGVKHSEIMIDKVNSVSFRNKLLLGEILIEDGASTKIISNVQKYSTQPFVDAVHKAITMSKSKNATIIQQTNISIADEILKLKQLFDSKIITQDEFEQQKYKLLNM